MASAPETPKPYVRINGYDPQGVPLNYKDLVKVRPLSAQDIEDIVVNSTNTTVINNTTVSGTSSPLTTKGDVWTYDTADQRLPVGSNDLPLVADSAETTGLKWKALPIAGGGTGQVTKTPAFDALAPTTAKGDLIASDGADNVRVPVGSDGQIILASSLATSGLAWGNVYSAAGASRIGLWYLFGAGIDGSLTLVANTTLAAGEWVRQYTDLTLAGFTLTQNTADYGLCIFVNGTLSMGGGTITSGFTALAGATRGNGNTLNSPSGYGGTGAATQGGIFVYAYIITGTGLISAAGKPGGNGNDGLSTPSGIVSGGNGNIGTTNSMYLFGTNITTGTAPAGGSSSPGGGNAAGAGGAGGAGGVGPTAAGGADYNQALKDVLAIIYCSAGGWAASANSKRRWITNNAASGAGGSGVNTGGTCAGGGGGGGGGSCGMWPGTPGGAGGAGGAAVASAPSAGQSGGGGGGGGSGSLVSVVCAILSGATLTVTANGGAGGNGGNAFGTNASGGGGGGGGCGGIALYVGPSGPTVTAGAGSGGAAGTKIGASANGVAGSAGTAGRVYSMTL